MTALQLREHVESLWPGLPVQTLTYKCVIQPSGKCHGTPRADHVGCPGGRRVYEVRSLACANDLCRGETLATGRSWSDVANKVQQLWHEKKSPIGWKS